MCIAQTFKDSTLTCVHLTSCEEGAITPILQIRKQEGLSLPKVTTLGSGRNAL